MACPELLETLKRIEKLLTQPKPLEIMASSYDGLLSTVGTIPKNIFQDDTTIPNDSLFSELTLRVRSMGTNTYIAFGVTSQNFRFTAIGQSFTYVAPIINNSIVPLMLSKVLVLGDAATGIIEITGIRVYQKHDEVQV